MKASRHTRPPGDPEQPTHTYPKSNNGSKNRAAKSKPTKSTKNSPQQVTTPHRNEPPAALCKQSKPPTNSAIPESTAPGSGEPGRWVQYDFGDGPIVQGRKTVLFVAWLAWSRYRVVYALPDKTASTVYAALDRLFRQLKGVPTYVLTDNEKMITTSHVAGVPVRNAKAADFGRQYGTTILTCAPADPASKGGVEAAVKLAKADIVPTAMNLRSEYDSFVEVEKACADFTETINTKVHAAWKKIPAEQLVIEQRRLHVVPDNPTDAIVGEVRTVPDNTPMVAYRTGQYSVPAHLLGTRVRVRTQTSAQGELVVISALCDHAWTEVARHLVAIPGSPSIDDAHFPDHDPGKEPGQYAVKPASKSEREFCAIGDGAYLWLTEAAKCGAGRIRATMADAVTLARVHGAQVVDRALGEAATYSRFSAGDLQSITTALINDSSATYVAAESDSLAQGTNPWSGHTTV